MVNQVSRPVAGQGGPGSGPPPVHGKKHHTNRLNSTSFVVGLGGGLEAYSGGGRTAQWKEQKTVFTDFTLVCQMTVPNEEHTVRQWPILSPNCMAFTWEAANASLWSGVPVSYETTSCCWLEWLAQRSCGVYTSGWARGMADKRKSWKAHRVQLQLQN